MKKDKKLLKELNATRKTMKDAERAGDAYEKLSQRGKKPVVIGYNKKDGAPIYATEDNDG